MNNLILDIAWISSRLGDKRTSLGLLGPVEHAHQRRPFPTVQMLRLAPHQPLHCLIRDESLANVPRVSIQMVKARMSVARREGFS